jgi:LysM repeat protein
MNRSVPLRFLLPGLLLLAGACAPGTGRPAPTPTATEDLRVVVTLSGRQAVTLTAPAPEPLPPPTPQPTATPTIYVVQSGDTLLAIALKYGVTVEAIQAANGNVQPQFLQIGQELIIPLGDEQPAASAGEPLILPTSTPLAVTLDGTGLHETPAGSVWLLGEVYNPTDAPAAHVQIHVVLVGPHGERLGESLVFPALDVIPPGGRAPFGTLFPARPAGLANFHVEVLSAETYAHDGPWVPGALQVTGEQGGPAGALFRVTGTLRNSGAAALDAAVVVTLYDEQGQVIGFEREDAGAVAPGASAVFDVRVTPAGSGAARYTLAVQGTKPK